MDKSISPRVVEISISPNSSQVFLQTHMTHCVLKALKILLNITQSSFPKLLTRIL